MMKRKNMIRRLRIKSAMTVLLITGALVTGNYSPSFAAPATKASATPQVLIGAGDAPRAGAMLDLNSTTQGLLLPTIELTADTTEFVLVDTDKASAYGMMIYNTNDEVADGKGVYVWSGSAWYLMTAFPVSVLLDPDAVTYGTIGLQDPLTLVLKPDQVQHKSVVWDSSNKTVATVDQTGVVTTLSNGSTTITATTPDGQVATCVVGVQNGCSDGVFAAGICWSTATSSVTNAQITCASGWRVPTVLELQQGVGNQTLGLTNNNYWSNEVTSSTVSGGCVAQNRWCVNGSSGGSTLVATISATPAYAGTYSWTTSSVCSPNWNTASFTCSASTVGGSYLNGCGNWSDQDGCGSSAAKCTQWRCTVTGAYNCSASALTTSSNLRCVKSL